MAASFMSSSNSRSAASYFQERAEDAADALRDFIGRSTGVGPSALGGSNGSAGSAANLGGGGAYLDTAEDKVALIAAQVNASSAEVQLDGLRRIIAMISKGRDASRFLPGVLKLTSSPSLEVRKLVYIIILTYARSSPEAEDLTLLSINSFQRDAADSSPLIRGMAIRVLTGLRNSLVSAVVEMCVQRAVRDRSAYVRKITALALPRCVESDPHNLESHLQSLSTLLGDRSPRVIGAALVAFQRIFSGLADSSAGAVASSSTSFGSRWELIHPHYRRMCHALSDMEEESQVVACEVLLHYARACFEEPVPGSKRDKDFSLLIQKSRSAALLTSQNAAVVFAAARLQYYLLPSATTTEASASGKEHAHAPLIRGLLALVSPGREQDRDVVAVALQNILWILNGGSARPPPAAQSKQRERARAYRKLFAPYITIFLPRSDCSRSKLAPGAATLTLVSSGASAASASSVSGTASESAGAALLEMAASTVTAAAAAAGSAAISPSSSGLTPATSFASSTATAAIFHLKLSVLSRLARPENLRWLVEELEEIARWDFRADRCAHALTVLGEVLERLSAEELERRGTSDQARSAFQPDRWGLAARSTKLALSVLADVSAARWQASGSGNDKAMAADNPMPVRSKVVQAAGQLLVSVLRAKELELNFIRKNDRSKNSNETLAILDDAKPTSASDDPKVFTPVAPKSATGATAAEGALELQLEMFDILQRMSDLLYTSGEAMPAPGSTAGDGAAAPLRKLKLVGKRNVAGPHERHTLFWALGEFCRVTVEVEWESDADAADDATASVVRRKSAAELLGVDVLRKAAGHFAKEPARAKLAIITLAAKVWTFLHTEASGAEADAKDASSEYADNILQQAIRDANLDLQAHARRYLAMLSAATSGTPSNKDDSAGQALRPEGLLSLLFVSDAQAQLAEAEADESTAEDDTFTGPEFGSLNLAIGNHRLVGSSRTRVPAWARPGTAVPASKREPPDDAAKVKSSAPDDEVEDAAAATSKPTRANGKLAAPAQPATAYDYFVEEDADTGSGAPSRSAAPTRTPALSTPSAASRSNSPFAAPGEQRRKMNPKYQDLDSFLDEDPADVSVLSTLSAPTQQFDALTILQQRAPQDEEYRDEYDEDDYEEVREPVAPSRAANTSRADVMADDPYARSPDSDDFEEEEDAGQAERKPVLSSAMLPEDNAWAS